MFGIHLRDGQDASFLQSGFLESSEEHQAGLPDVFWLCQTLFEADFSVWNISKEKTYVSLTDQSEPMKVLVLKAYRLQSLYY